MAPPLLETIAWSVTMIATLFALVSFGRGVAHLWRQVSAGRSAPGRLRPVGQRLWGMFATALTHREFTGRPLVKVAHWFVMVSFPLLFLTLVTGYAQLRDQTWSLPVIGHLIPWEWVVELFAWGGFLGILALMVIRARSGHGAPGEAELSQRGDDTAHTTAHGAPRDPGGQRPASAGPDGHFPRDGSPAGIASRFLGSTRWQALVVEWTVLLVCACVIVLRGLEYALAAGDAALAPTATAWHYPMTGWLGAAALSTGGSPTALAASVVVVSAVKICVSMVWLMIVGVQTSMGIAWHRFLAVVNLYARREPDGRKALGPAAPMLVGDSPVTDLDQIPDDAELGVGTAADLTWKARLDFSSCTECGRCQELCPAWNTQKPLSPKLLVLALRDHVEAVSNTEVAQADVPDDQVPGDGRVLMDKGVNPVADTADVLGALAASGATGPQGVSVVEGPLVPDVVSPEVLWDCTMCGACVEQCPVDIEHVDHILDLRRHQVLMESAFPRELGRAFRGMETKGNPYNLPARRRLDWATGLDFDVPVIGEDVESAEDVDYLFWVGCAGASDDRAKRTTAAVAELLHTAGVSFAVLGSAESCTGDPARRAGNEVLFQMLASAAIDTLHEARAQKIVVTCAHCFNAIAGEFPQLGGTFEVIHHTQLLNRLVRDGLLRPVAPTVAGPSVGVGRGRAEAGSRHEGDPSLSGPSPTITYHDPCFLGRHNQVYEPPRELLGALPGVNLVEMPRSRERAMCCGAGGARAWMEETRGIRIADARMAEAASTGASVVATACPFCSQMLGSATGSSLPEPDGAPTSLPEVRDVALLLLDGVRRGQTPATGAGMPSTHG